MTAWEQAFGAWCREWYELEYGPEVPITAYTTKEDQRHRGDVRVGPHNYDEKAYAKAWDGCLVELLQASEPDAAGRVTSVGWFYELEACDYLLCGYADAHGLVADAYQVSLRRLRRHYAEMMRVTTADGRARAVIARGGYGVTVAVVIPWATLGQYGCARQVWANGALAPWEARP